MKIYCAPRGETDGRTAAYALLQDAFSRNYTGKLPIIEKTPNGKPFFPERPDVHFSISHSMTHVLCALSNHPVGADIEYPRHISNRAIAYFASPAELSIFKPLELWVLKESYVKLLGKTLPTVREIKFGKQGADPCLLGQETDPRLLFRLYNMNGCPAAVATLGVNPPDKIEFVEPYIAAVIASETDPT